MREGESIREIVNNIIFMYFVICVFHHTAAPVRVEALVEPPDADTLVACYTDLNCVTFDTPISQTIRDCCLNNARGRAYSAFGSELCIPCEGKHKINHVKNRSNIHS